MVQRVLELLWWRERDRLEQRADSREVARERHWPEPGAEKQRQRERDRSWWTVDSGIASPERECVARERERVDERDEKVKSSVLFIYFYYYYF